MKVQDLIDLLEKVTDKESDIILHQLGDNPGTNCVSVDDRHKYGYVLLVGEE